MTVSTTTTRSAAALLSAGLLVAVLVGFPLVMSQLVGWPLPKTLPTVDGLRQVATEQLSARTIVDVLAVGAWLAWAHFVACVLVELRGALTGRHLRVPFGGVSQQFAGQLVAALLLGAYVSASTGLTPAAAYADPAPPAAAVGIWQAQLPANDVSLSTPPAAARSPEVAAAIGAEEQQAWRLYTVRGAHQGYTDNLWDIAEQHLGDGTRWREVFELNQGRDQDVGGRLTDPDVLRAGWQLRMPADATDLPPVTPAAAERQPAGQHVVQPGQTLHQIAHAEFGVTADHKQLYETNVGRPQPDGGRLTDPDLIRPGWVLDLPGVEAAPPLSDAPPAPVYVAPAPLVGEVPVVVGTPAPSPPGASVDDGPGGQAQDLEEAASAGDGVLPTVRTTTGVGALLACSLLVLLTARRRRQTRRRRPAQRIPMPPPELEQTEWELRAVQDPDSRVRVDRALRTLSVLLGGVGRSLPVLCLVRVQEQHLELYLADECALPAPFAATQDPAVWTLDPRAPLLSADELMDIAAPYPALVTIGHDAAGGHVLLDLEQAGALSVVGDQPAALAVLAALAVELATSDWADHVQVTLVGCFPELPDALGTGRVRYAPTLRAVLPELERHAADVRTVLRADGLRDLEQARTATPGEHLHGDVWMPDIVLIAGPVEPSLRPRLDAVLHTAPHGGVAAVLVDAGPVQWRLRLGEDDGPEAAAVLSPYGVELRPQRLTGPDLTELLALLAIASRPAAMPDGQVAAVSADLTVADLGRELPVADTDAGVSAADRAKMAEASVVVPAGTGAGEPGAEDPERVPDAEPPTVLVLGPVVVHGARGTLEAGKRNQLTEIAAFLALQPGADHHRFSEAIWRGARAVDQTRNTALSKLRSWLGPQFVPRVTSNGYRMEPTVKTDWHQWQELLAAGPAATSTVDLATALGLVRGQPFEGHPPDRFAWAERARQEMISAIGDAAHELWERAWLAGDATLARRAAAAGLQAEPGNEMLWRDALEAEWLAGDRAGLERIAGRMIALAEDLGDELEPESLALLGELRSGRPRTAARRNRTAPPETVG